MKRRFVVCGVMVSLGLCVAQWEHAAGAAPLKSDMFGEIAAQKIDYANRNLVPTPPPKITPRVLPATAGDARAAFRPAEKMTTPEQVHAELLRQRERMAPFLQDLAPPLADQRIRTPLDSFDWRLETSEDRSDFPSTLAGKGNWQRVTIPHFGPPMGRAIAYYRTEFDVTQRMLDRGALFVRFLGVDYKADVFVNGSLLGSHVGLFSPFEFEFASYARLGKNVLVVRVTNDLVMMGNNPKTGFQPGTRYPGSKVCANVGLGWDDPATGWHCNPGMGICRGVAIEARRRIHVHDIFVRPLQEPGKAEAWIEVFNCDYIPVNVTIDLSAFGQNFKASACHSTVQKLKGIGALSVGAGVSRFRIPITLAEPRSWEPDAPWLYQLQVRLLDDKGRLMDTAKRQFGLRTFRMEYEKEPKGRMYLNGHPIKLRGANTMGAFQRCVAKKDWRQLIDDILLAKITHMNYIRLTQTPVEAEVYDYCDRLGLLLQTDLPLFFLLTRTEFCEVVRQAEEMERLVRSHPSNIMVTYINEPTPKFLQRSLARAELTGLFEAADTVVHMANPDRVTKAVDGDYDPPGPGLPDNHCYCGWYNGHGVDLGALHKGFWQRVKPGWVFGCGEFGSEGLDSIDLMRKYYPKTWLPQSHEEEKRWTPAQIPVEQTSAMHYYFFETPHSLTEWVERSRAHQAWATRVMTEAFRRDSRMHSFAIHLFVDAFPNGWMKAIVDYDRQPKPAWFAYRDALTPLAVSLRSDRRAFYADEPIDVEAWVCNDRNDAPRGAALHYQLEADGRILASGSTPVSIPVLDSAYQGTLRFPPVGLASRGKVTIRLGLLDADGTVLHDTSLDLDVFTRRETALRRLYVVGDPKGKAAQLVRSLGAQPVLDGKMTADDAILIDDLSAFAKRETEISQAVRAGATALLMNLPAGKYRIAGDEVRVGGTPSSVHFASRNTGHPLVAGFQSNDFWFWHDAQLDRPSPMVQSPGFQAKGWEPILLTFEHMAAGRRPDGKGSWCICQIELAGRIAGNPVAAIFVRRLLSPRLSPLPLGEGQGEGSFVPSPTGRGPG
jgi:beta-galactosidase/beta-glucuronidase